MAFASGRNAFLKVLRQRAELDHGSLVRVRRIWEENGTAYQAMPYPKGPTLTDTRQEMARPPDEAWLRDRLLLPLLGALAQLHAADILHGDVSPESILMLADERTLLLDIGVMRRLHEDTAQPAAPPTHVDYAPIELLVPGDGGGGTALGPWSDVYSLAAVTCFAITGVAPPTALLRQRHALAAPSEAIRETARGHAGLHYSDAFLAALDAAFALRSEDRLASTQAFVQALAAPADLPESAESAEDADVFEQAQVAEAHEPGMPPAAAMAPRLVEALEPVPEIPTLVPAPTPDTQPDSTPEPAFELDFTPKPAPQAPLESDPLPLPAMAHQPEPALATAAPLLKEVDPPPMQPLPRWAPEAPAQPRSTGKFIAIALALALVALVGWLVLGGTNPATIATDAPVAPVSATAASADGPAVTASGAAPLAAANDPVASTLPEAPAAGLPEPTPAASAAATVARAADIAASATAPEPRVATVATVPAATPAPAVVAPVRKAVTPPPPSSPRAMCGQRTNFSLYNCMQKECKDPRFVAHAQCKLLRERDVVE